MITQEYHHLIRNIPIEQATKKFVRIHELTLIFYGNIKRSDWFDGNRLLNYRI